MTGNRDIAEERALTHDAGNAAGVVGLVRFSEQRAGTGAVRDLDRRDFRLETLEELADARNYLVWAYRQSRRSGDLTTALHIKRVLAAVVVAYDLAVALPDTPKRLAA